jgi:hypothetical protein
VRSVQPVAQRDHVYPVREQVGVDLAPRRPSVPPLRLVTGRHAGGRPPAGRVCCVVIAWWIFRRGLRRYESAAS